MGMPSFVGLTAEAADLDTGPRTPLGWERALRASRDVVTVSQGGAEVSAPRAVLGPLPAAVEEARQSAKTWP